MSEEKYVVENFAEKKPYVTYFEAASNI